MKAKRILVTGGLGFLGASLVKALQKQGHAVKVLDDASRGSADRLGETAAGVEIVRGDIRDNDAVRKAVQGTETVFHLAAVNGTRHFYEKPGTVLEIGVKGTMTVLENCVKSGVKEFFFASSSEAYQTPERVPTDETETLRVPDPFNPRYSYGGSKILGELLTIHGGGKEMERAIIFRPHNVYGPAMGWEHVIPQLTARILQMKASSPAGEIPLPIQGSGGEMRAFIYADDFTDALMTLFEKGEHMNIYHIGTMEMVPISEVAQRIARCLGGAVRLVPCKEAAGGTPRRCPDTRKLQKLGFQPKISFDEGLRRTVEWYSKQAWQQQDTKISTGLRSA